MSTRNAPGGFWDSHAARTQREIETRIEAMNTPQSHKWIDGNQRLPENHEMPIWSWREGSRRPEFVTELRYFQAKDFFWQPAIVPEPPKREPTQDQLDADTARALCALAYPDGYPEPIADLRKGFCHGVRAGIDNERDHVRALLKGVNPESQILVLPNEDFAKLAQRVGLKS